MSYVSVYEEAVQVLGIPLTLKISTSEEINVLNVIGISENGEARHLYIYLSNIDAIQPNKKEINDLIDEYGRRSGKLWKFLIITSDAFIWIINTFMNIATGIFGNIGGFGIIGIMIVLGILLALLMLWIYALVIIIPLMAISYGMRLWLDKTKERATRTLSKEAWAAAKRYCGRTNSLPLMSASDSVAQPFSKEPEIQVFTDDTI